jgi:hypothetical protein
MRGTFVERVVCAVFLVIFSGSWVCTETRVAKDERTLIIALLPMQCQMLALEIIAIVMLIDPANEK